MTYLFEPYGRTTFRIVVVHGKTGFILGYLEVGQQPFQVCDPDGGLIALVKDVQDALPRLLDYHEAHPAQWEQDGAEHLKDTHHGLLSVAPERLGFWSVYRNSNTTLVHHGKPAAFRTAAEAKVAADAHLRDGGKPSKDGFEWSPLA
jgi:hypothetical protein